MKADDLNANRFVLDLKNSADLRLKMKQDPQAGLKQAAQQFEGMLLQMMLKSMREATSQDGLLNSEQTRFFTGILDQQLAQNLAAKGSLGFAKQIEQQLGRTLAAGQATTASLDSAHQALLESQAASSAALPATTSVAGGAARIRSRGEGSQVPVTESASGVVGANASGRDFVNRVWPHAVSAANSLGVPPHFLVAHSALESGWGRSEIKATDGSSTYNIFGIKAGRSWQGATVEVPTTEYVNGVAQTVREKFRAYASYGEAFQDYAALLKNNPRFAGVLGQQEGTGFARSLQQSGYATDPQYADKLGRIINGNTLRQALVG
ncbi:flagellar assembly peptidoglycan hydrolase FlgJ [Propionivibrio limicola]|uniref:flagellar assembly peptidoglycan hydrolase FlgJ n=1 Tax=Propionivibrio limicola TaxID=167645 RepID=UPI001290AAD1|nr:flagellar assembly peptidoglycan hydrolase FlgJ [Propionivibrio limicola]